jgi:hypothetical protein
VVECTALEMRHRCKPIGGSNPSLSASSLSVRLGKPFRSEGCHAKAHRAKGRAALHASYGPAGHPAIISGKTAARPTRFSLPTKISKTTPCKVTGGSLAWMLYPRKHFDTSGKSVAPFHHRAICKTAHGAAHRALGVITGQKPRQLKLHRLATSP